MQLKEEKTKQLARKEKKKKHTASEVPTLIYYGIWTFGMLRSITIKECTNSIRKILNSLI